MMQTAGKLFIISIEGTSMTPETRELLGAMKGCGIILFRKNYASLEQVNAFIAEIRSIAGPETIVSVDQEGGRVMRLGAPFSALPPMRAIGNAMACDPTAACATGRTLATELASVGINLDFAPVLDCDTNPMNPVIGDRSFSPDPDLCARAGVDLIRGLQENGVAACGKHFPGHGDTDLDSHLALPTIHHDLTRLNACEFIPFRAAIAANVASLMTAHIMVPHLDATLPATVSPVILTGLLRRQMGFQGVVFTDDLTMKGMTAIFPPEESAWRAIRAGADAAIICHNATAAINARARLEAALRNGELETSRVNEAIARVERLAKRFALKC